MYIIMIEWPTRLSQILEEGEKLILKARQQ